MLFPADTALIVAFIALAMLLIPLPRWQALLLWMSGFALRITGFAMVVAAAVFGLVIRKSPVDFAQSLGSGSEMITGTQPADWLVVAALLVALLMPVAAFLDFSRRLLRTSRQTDELLKSLSRTSSLMREALDRDAGPGAVLSPQRCAELRDALSGCSEAIGKRREVAPMQKSFVRNTLAELVK